MLNSAFNSIRIENRKGILAIDFVECLVTPFWFSTISR